MYKGTRYEAAMLYCRTHARDVLAQCSIALVSKVRVVVVFVG